MRPKYTHSLAQREIVRGSSAHLPGVRFADTTVFSCGTLYALRPRVGPKQMKGVCPFEGLLPCKFHGSYASASRRPTQENPCEPSLVRAPILGKELQARNKQPT